ncbi:MAG: ATP-binding cassette domain-containing protein [Litoreibacter sp.]
MEPNKTSLQRRHTDFVAALGIAAGWTGETAQLKRVAPMRNGRFLPQDYVFAIENLDLIPHSFSGSLASLKRKDVPCLFSRRDEPLKLITQMDQKTVTMVTEGTGVIEVVPRNRARGSFLTACAKGMDTQSEEMSSLSDIIRTRSGQLAAALGITTISNILSLIGPLLVMSVYDKVIPAASTELIFSFALIAGIILLADFALRALRSWIFAGLGTNVEQVLSLFLFEKLLSLPVLKMTRSSLHQQLSRVKQFDAMRNVFTGALTSTLFDLPFVLLFLGVIFAVAPNVAALLVGAIAVFLTVTLIFLPIQQRATMASGKAATAHNSFLYELAENAQTIAHLGLGGDIQTRSETLARDVGFWHAKQATIQAFFQSFCQMMMSVVTIGAIAFATLSAIDGTVTFGALIAVTTLVGRVLGPVNALANSAMQIVSLRGTARQANGVLTMDDEFTRGSGQSQFKMFDGGLSISNAFLRFDTSSEPSVSGVSVELDPGNLVVLSGKSGAGKTTLMKAIAKLYPLGNGTIRLDNINIKQLAVEDLRNAISYCDPEASIFPMTLRENIMLGNPHTYDAEIKSIFAAIGAERDLRRFRQGLDTDLATLSDTQLSSSVMRTIAIVRCLAKPASVFMLDDAMNGLSQVRAKALWAYLETLKEKATVIITSNRFEHMNAADRLLVMDQGRMLIDDTGHAAAQRGFAMVNFDQAAA